MAPCVHWRVSEELLVRGRALFSVNQLGANLNVNIDTMSLKQHYFPVSQVNGWDMTMVTHDQARKRLTKKNEDVVRLLVTRKSLEEVVKQSMGQWPR